MTKRQYEVLEWVRNFIKTQGFSPSLDEIREGLGLKAISTVQKHIWNLKAKGKLFVEHNRSRSISVGGSLRGRKTTCEHCGEETRI